MKHKINEQEVREKFRLNKISSHAALAVMQVDILEPFNQAGEAFKLAYQPVEEARSRAGGYGLFSPAKQAESTMSDEEKQEAEKKLEEANKKLLEALNNFARHINEKTRPTRYLILFLGTLSFLCGVAIIIWGVINGTRIALIGKDGAASFLISVVAIPMFWKYYNFQNALRLLPARIRFEFSVCDAANGYADKVECFRRAHSIMGRCIEELQQISKLGTSNSIQGVKQ